MKYLSFILMMLVCISAYSQKKVQQTTVATSVVKTVPAAVKGTDVLNAIIKEYKGKAVVVDFWATWCRPCMFAMKQIDPIKESYISKGSPVEFVYITGETSPKEIWTQTIKNIKGKHYRITKDQWETLLGSLGVRGIPTYIIYNKAGKKSYDNIDEGGYPGDEIIEGEIAKAIK